MNAPSDTTLDAYLHREIGRITDACTRCGKCVEVCPVVPFGAAAGQPAGAVVGSVVDFLGGKASLSEGATGWATTCNGCGDCIEACPEGVNPRKMLMLANIRDAEKATRTPLLFRKMTRAIKLLAAMQLMPAEYARLFAVPRPRPAPYVFYLGCNALRTPHLLFNAMSVLDALDVDYEVIGGPASCCGVISAKWEGQVKVGEGVTRNTINRFEGFAPERVLNWCPTCQLHLGETLEGFRPTSYSFDHITAYLISRQADLTARFTTRISKRVVLHTHVGHSEVGRDVAALLQAIPGLDLVESVPESGYTCGGSGCSRQPALQAIEHGHLLDRMRETKADMLVTLYHGCHASFVGAEKEGGFEVVSFTDLLVEALGGTPHVDRLKDFARLSDWQMIIDDAAPFLRANGVDIDPAWLRENLAEIFASAEFKGGLDCFGSADLAAKAVDSAGHHH